VLPAAVGTIAASLLVWVATRDGRTPETKMASADAVTESRPLPTPAQEPARPQLSELKKEQPATPVDELRQAKPAAASKMARLEPSAAPVEAPKQTPLPATGFSTVGGVAGGVAQAPPPKALPAPPPPAVTSPTAPPPARQAAVSGLPQSTINITLDGVSVSDPRRSSETFFAMVAIKEFSSPPFQRLDAVENVVVAKPPAGDATAVFRSGAGAGGGGGGAGGGRGGGGAGRGGAAAAGMAGGVPADRGAIEGSIQDPAGGTIPGATVQARALGSGLTTTATTDNLGNYRIAALAPGAYTVTATLQGFVTQVFNDVVVEAGKTARTNVTLTVGAISESVTVAAASSALRDQLDQPRQTRWRIFADNVIHRSSDGTNWTTVRLEAGLPQVTTGVAPSPTICWLVGRSGLVLVMSNGTTFRRMATPANVDLVAVQATDALRATVTADNGRQFTTADGGLTWK
jgi:hypothetical protein